MTIYINFEKMFIRAKVMYSKKEYAYYIYRHFLQKSMNRLFL